MTPRLLDRAGRLLIGPGFDGECSAPTVTRDGHVVGVYIDDSTPDIEHWVAIACAKYPGGLVLVAVAPAQPDPHHPAPVLACREWYPYGSGVPVWAWGQMPGARAYILQSRFAGFAGTHQPNWFQRRRLIRQALAHHPELILLY